MLLLRPLNKSPYYNRCLTGDIVPDLPRKDTSLIHDRLGRI